MPWSATAGHCKTWRAASSVSGRRCPPPPSLEAWLQARRPLPAHVAYLEQRYAEEPYRLALALLAADLDAASQDDMTARLLDDTPHRARLTADELRQVLGLVARSLPEPLATERLRLIRRQLDTFGLHAARLDVREDAGRLAVAVGRALDGLGIVADFERRDDTERSALLTRLLMDEPPEPAALTRVVNGMDERSAETWRLFRLLVRASRLYGRESLGPFVVSMTRGAADVLAVLLLARWAGGVPGLMVVPLFETLADLDAAPRIMAELFLPPSTRAT